MINNFGINHLSWIGETKEEDEDILQINLMMPYWIINHLVRMDVTADVVNVASATHRVVQRCSSLYSASKAGLVQMTKVMNRELSHKGWRLNSISPGSINDTEMTRLVNEQVCELRCWTPIQAREYALSMVPANRSTTGIEVAKAIWKMFELPDYIAGTNIDMMGGV